ncbi:haloacid dehalogenase [Lentzea tibetensis]|uniref:Haloacid dehalogenase n=1 Tax=Lentzea tibetensis TaxID=2591470 RepID=A0A563ERK8_9PSEU|nr:HAD hydrolase-like protein [Lentzea tibetensis]TWP50161.1 haloacid dehalogenase [Lentzea tibetensis]
MRTLVLWDIDRTLVHLGGLGLNWYRDALTAVAGVELTHLPSFGGRTEQAISRDILRLHGVAPTDELVASLHAELVAAADRDATRIGSHGRALPGASEALAGLAAVAGVVQTVVTGNLPTIARQKLTPFGMDAHVDFSIGGYGSLSEFRPDLVTEALRLATAKHGVAAASVVVIGDTEHDVEAALHHGFRAIGVATGSCGADELRAAGAHAVFADLSDTDEVLSAVLG